MEKVVIAGASLAGVHAAGMLREEGFAGELVLVGAEQHLPYDRPPLSKEALRNGPRLDDLLLKDRSWYTDNHIELKLGQEIRSLDTDKKSVSLLSGEEITFDGLVIATGSVPRKLPPELEGSSVLRSYDDALKLHDELQSARRLMVIGAGFIGLELAATAVGLGVDVTVVEIAPVPLTRVLGDEVGGWILQDHLARGVNFKCGTSVVSIEHTRTGKRVTLSDHSVVEVDLIVAGVGVLPATEWLSGSGVTVSDGVVCDSSLRTSVEGIVAAGDIARWFNPLFDEEMRVEQWSNAMDQGRHAARTLLGNPEPFASVPYFWTDQYEVRMRFIGRSNAADQVRVEEREGSAMIAVFGRNGVEIGALCVNAPRELAAHRNAIMKRDRFEEFAATT